MTLSDQESWDARRPIFQAELCPFTYTPTFNYIYIYIYIAAIRFGMLAYEANGRVY